LVTVSGNEPDRVVPPPVRVRVTLDLPGVAFAAAVNLTVLDWLPVPDKVAGVKVQVTPAGSPAAARLITELNPLGIPAVRVAVVEDPVLTVNEPLEMLAVKLGGRITVRVKV
jgi:hypothetical protein